MKAYLNDLSLKVRFIEELEKHKKADAITQGTYGRKDDGQWKGCAVACSLRSLDIIDGNTLDDEYLTHGEYETRLGIPRTIAHLEDQIFEGLPKEKAMEWPLRFANAIQVGADLSLVTPKFMVWMLGDVKQHASTFPDVLRSIDGVIALYERVLAGGQVTDDEWSAAAYAAYAAARAARAAYAAADAAYAAADAAYAAADAARAAAFEGMADKLIELLEAATVS